MSNQSIVDGSADVDRLAGRATLLPWRFFTSLAVMAAIWGLLYLIAWLGQPGFILAILMIYAGPLSAVTVLAILISLPVLSPVIRIPISLALLLVVTCVVIGFFEGLQSDEMPLWLLLIACQFLLVVITSVVVGRVRRFRTRRSGRFSLLTLILTVTVVCVGLGAVRAICEAFEISLADVAASRVTSFLTVALINATAAIGPLTALAPQRIRFRMLLLIMGLPQALLLSLAILWLHDWAMPDEQVLNTTEMTIFIGIQAVAVSLGLLPILLASKLSSTTAKVELPPANVLQQEP